MRKLLLLTLTLLCFSAKSQILPHDDKHSVSFHDIFPTQLDAYEACETIEMEDGLQCVPSAIKSAFTINSRFVVPTGTKEYVVTYYGIINVIYSHLSYTLSDFRVNGMPIGKWEKLPNLDAGIVEHVESRIFCHTVFLVARLRGSTDYSPMSNTVKVIPLSE